MSPADSRNTWSRFWEQRSGTDGGCLPHAFELIDRALARAWRDFAGSLPRGGKVLDLATGDGVVLGRLRAARHDLKLVGVDSSPVLPASPKGVKLKAGVAMERLPFSPASFDAVTSQFGIEYGDIAPTAAAIRSVLKPGRSFQFVVHHRDGPIVAHNLPRREALAWALSTSGHFDKAMALAKARMAMRLPTPPAFHAAPADAMRRFPDQPVAHEFTLAILQTLELSQDAAPQEAIKALVELRDRATNEMGRIDALAGAALDRAGLEKFLGHLKGEGLDADDPRLLRENDRTMPFAWLVSGHASPR